MAEELVTDNKGLSGSMAFEQRRDVSIVAVESVHCPLREFSLASTSHKLSTYQWTSSDELAERVVGADVIITTTIGLPAAILNPDVTPRPRLVIVMALGTDCVDKEAARARGIQVCNCPATNVNSVSEHAIGLYFAIRRKFLLLNTVTNAVPVAKDHDTEWKTNGSMSHWLRTRDGRAPLLCSEETMEIIGFGALGKAISTLGENLGMKILIAEHKGHKPRTGRHSFQDVLIASTVIMVCLPRTEDTFGLISSNEFRTMRPETVLINVARGGIVDESALVEALQRGGIAGAATDVYAREPVGRGDSPLLRCEPGSLNLVLTPHLAWFSEQTSRNLQHTVKVTLESWSAGKSINRVV